MIKFKNINNLYGFNCLNIKVVKMKNETKKQASPIESANSNVNLKTHLTLALKNTSSIMKVLLPKIAVSVKELIFEYKKLTEKNTDTDDKKNQIQMKALREHCYNLVGYNRKTDPNSAFEMVCTRAVKLGLMMIDHPNKFDVDAKNSQVFVMSKIATPFIIEKKEGQKSSINKKPNTDETLVEVNTGVIDRVYNVEYGNPNPRKPKTKDDKVELTFKDNAKSFYKLFNKALDYSKKKDVRFFDLVDEETMKQLSLIDTLFNGENYKVMRSFSLDYQVSLSGELEKTSLNKKTA
tara:strand:+ start:173 stop:1051 length:879 start_codon:yes stop_codon:yes gene_type:complete